jgi:murein L,D-transpeptidase YafK
MKETRLRLPLLVGTLVLLVACLPSGWCAEQNIKADRIIVKKAERLLLLLHKKKVLFVFPIALGDEPEGDKLEEGDWRTPEGSYVIDWRNPQSRFYKSLHISYPDHDDMLASAVEGVAPGGMIMIHGLPPDAEMNLEKYVGKDWTDGCIALSNEDMDIVWATVDDGTPIDIFP